MQGCLSNTGYHNRDCANFDGLPVLLIRRLICEIYAKYEIPLHIIEIMKELGLCPRCKSSNIHVHNTPGRRMEICENCGFVDTYVLGSYKNPGRIMIISIMLGILPLVGYLVYLFFLR